MRRIYLLILLSAILHHNISAQGMNENIGENIKTDELEEVVVTGQYQPQSVKNSVYNVRTISKEQIQKQGASKLQDVLLQQLNIRFRQDPATGGSDINMMGLSGQNVKILIDGMPVIGRQGTSNEININQIDIYSIERIEIVEGPMSVIYGADALAGVINIITKKETGNKFGINAGIHEETAGNEYGLKQGIHNQHIGGNYNYKNWYFSAGAGRNLFNGWKDTATGRELLWHKKDQLTANAMAGYHNDKLDISYRIDALDEIIYNPANFIGSQPASDQEYLSKRFMHQLKGRYHIKGNLIAGFQSSYTNYSRETTTILFYPNGDERLATAPGSYSFTEFTGLTLRGNIVYRPSEKISFQPGFDINMETGSGERIKSGVQKINDYAFYITAEYKPWKNLNLRPGVRFISNSVYDAPPVIPSINLKWAIQKNLDFRVAYARGFRSPSIRELYFEFHDGSHDIIGNQNLQAEYSHSFTGSLNLNTIQKQEISQNIKLSAFYNDVENMIGYALLPDNPRITTYTNIDNYKTTGFSLSGDVKYKNLTAEAGAGYTGRYNQITAQDKSVAAFKWSPEINVAIGYNFPKAAMNINFYYKYIGKLPYYQLSNNNGTEEIVLRETNGYHWSDISINKKIIKYFY